MGGGGSPVLDQDNYWFGDDDGDEASNTLVGSKNTGRTHGLGNKRIRFGVGNSGTKAATGVQLQLEYNKNSLGWNAVNASSSVVRMAATANLTEGNNTTERLAGARTFDTTNGGQEDNDGLTAANNLANGEEIEADFCYQLIDADVANSDTIELRVTNAGTVLDSYPATHATITVLKASTYEDALTLAVTNRTTSPAAALTREGLLSLAIANKTVANVPDFVYETVVNLANSRGVALVGNTIMELTLATLGLSLGDSYNGGLSFEDTVTLSNSKAVTLLANLIREGLLTENRTHGVSQTNEYIVEGSVTTGSIRTLVLDGILNLFSDTTLGLSLGDAYTGGLAFETLVTLAQLRADAYTGEFTYEAQVALAQTKAQSQDITLIVDTGLVLGRLLTISQDGNLLIDTSVSLSHLLGLTPDMVRVVEAAISMARSVSFLTIHEYVAGGGSPATYPDVELTAEIATQAAGSVAIVPTPTGIVIIDLT